MSTIQLEVVTPTRPGIKVAADFVVVPTADGIIGILPGHTPLMAPLVPGILRYEAEGNSTKLAISDGYLEVTPEKILVLAEAAEMAGEIDVNRALAAKRRAEERLSGTQNDGIDFYRARASLERALARLQVAGGGQSGSEAGR